MVESIERLFERDLFKGITESQQTIVRRALRPTELKQGECIFNQGEAAAAFYYVVSGWIVVSRLHESGANTVLHVFGPDEFFAEVAALAIGDFPAAAHAATESTVLSIPASVYRKLIEEDAGFAMNVIGSLAFRMHALIRDFERSQHSSGPSRLAAFLLDLANKDRAKNGDYELPFSKQLLAARLHMQPETLSRAFSELRKVGVESSRDGHVHITSMEELNKLVKY